IRDDLNEEKYLPIEKQLHELLKLKYSQTLSAMKKLDRTQTNTISYQEFRSIIEDLLEFPLKPDEFYQILTHVPEDEHGKIKYSEYLQQFKSQSMEKELQQQNYRDRQDQDVNIPDWDYKRNEDIRERLDDEQAYNNHERKKAKEKKQREAELNDESSDGGARSFDELREVIKTLIRTRYKEIEDEFKIIDKSSYGELTQNMMFDLFKKLNIKPPITHTEIKLLWTRCHLKVNNNLDFYQFLREFGYTKRSATYPNAKRNPPRRGDCDFLLTSRKLYADNILVHGSALNAIRSNWDELRREFTELDPYRTGYIMGEEFDDVLYDICPVVNQEDLETFKTKFKTGNDGRIHYVKFLKYHAPIPEMVSQIDNNLSVQESPRSSADKSILSQVMNKLRRKLTDDFKPLRRAFKQRDVNNTGGVPVLVFKDLLKKFK
ncbi:unnamed protein product, partial [Didymodactylos carnosus]